MLISTLLVEMNYCDKSSKDALQNLGILAALCLSLLGKFFTSACFAIAYCISAELYPTMVRANAVGICSMISRIGAILAPLVIASEGVASYLPGSVIGVCALMAGVLSRRLPETNGQGLLMSFEEANIFYRRSKYYQ